MGIDTTKRMSESEENRIRDRVTKSRVQMLINMPFFGILALNLQTELTYDTDTAATDGKKLYFNPYFIKGLSDGEVSWVVIHEVLHPALKHLFRKGNRNHKKWNIACDYAIHDIMTQYQESLNNKKLLKMPDNVLYNKNYKDKGAEEIYDLLPIQVINMYFTLDDHGMWGEGGSEGDSKQKQAEWDGRLINAAQAAEGKGKGDLPAFLKRLIGKITRPQRDWRSLLAEFVQPEIDDYSFSPPDRRFGDSDFFLPDFNDESISVKKLLFWVDTSGSISEKILTTFYSEIVGAVNQFANKLTGYIGFFDAVAYKPKEFGDVSDILDIKPQGGGGTIFEKPFEYTNEHFDREDVTGIVFLTDGYCDWPNEDIAKGIPVLWVITNETRIPPWGLKTTIKV